MNKQASEKAIQAWVQLHRAHRSLLEEVEKSLKNNGLPPLDWYDVLLELQREKTAGLRQFEIGEKVLLNKHNLSRLIDRLEKNSLVSRHPCEEDGRGNRIHITRDGESMLKRMWPVYSQAIEDNFSAMLKRDECDALSRVLAKLGG